MKTLIPAGSPPARQRGSAGRLLLSLVIVLAALGAAWTWISLSWSYSEGERAGVLQKFSRKGWICKTDEGELALYIVAGVAPQIWEFSVRDPAVVADLYHNVGRRVSDSRSHTKSGTGCSTTTRTGLATETWTNGAPTTGSSRSCATLPLRSS